MLCCGTPDDANEVDQNEPSAPANKIAKAGQRATSASVPENPNVQQDGAAQSQQSEKDALRKAENGQDRQEAPKDSSRGAANGEISRPAEAREEPPLPDLPKESEQSSQPDQTNPAVILQAPDPSVAPALTETEKDAEGDTKMQESEPLPTIKKDESPAPTPTRRSDENIKTTPLPPPPPVPQPVQNQDPVAPENADGKQQWLLPPIAPRFKGKKCLVLDLDETLVHSSFKVRLFT